MNSFFVGFHLFASKRKVVFFLLLLGILLLSLFTIIKKMSFSEDITSIIPDDDRINKINAVLSNSDFADQLIFTFSFKDSAKVNPRKLIKAAEHTYELLNRDTSFIKNIQFKTSDGKFLEVYDFFYENLPLFLTDEDYIHIETLLSAHSIEKTLEGNYKSLTSLVGLVTKDLIFKDPLSLTPLALKKLENFHLDRNFVFHDACVFTKDRKYLLFFLQPTFSSSNTRENKKLIAIVEEVLIATQNVFPEVKVEYYGGTAVAVANAARVKSDIMLTVSVAFILLFFLFYIIFKRLKNILLIFTPIALGLVIALALLILLNDDVSAIALGIGAILIGISLDYSLHIFTHFRSSGSVIYTLKKISTPVLMSCLSTASVFLTLFVVKSQALNQLGMFAAFAIVITALLVLMCIPFFLKVDKERISLKNNNKSVFDKIAAYAFEKNKIMLAGILLLSVVFVFTSKRLEFNSDISSLNYITKDLAKAEQNLNNISAEAKSAVYFVIQGHSYEEVLTKTENNMFLFEQALKDSVIYSFSSPVELIVSEEKQLERINKWTSFWQKNDKNNAISVIKEKGRQFHFRDDAFNTFYELLERDFDVKPTEEFGVLKDAFLSNRLSKTDSVYSAVTIIRAADKGKETLFDKFKDNKDVIIFDNQYFTNQFLEVLKGDFRLLVMLSMLVVFLILLLFFGRIEIALITFFPIVLSWLWTIGIMGLLGIKFNIFNIIISTFILGLGVDYSIFIVSGLLNNYKYGQNNLTPYKLSVLLSATTTILALGVLIFAKHPALKSIAPVSIVGIISVVVITYTILPLLFSFIISNKKKLRKEPVTMFNFFISIVTLFIYFFGTILATFLLPLIIIIPLPRKTKKLLVHYIICCSSRFIVYSNMTITKNYINKDKLDFSKPVVFVANHQSHLDLVLILLLNPKIIVLTNNWVWHSPFFGSLVRYAGFYPAFKGLNYGIDKIEEKINDGYSVLIFPEGTRSVDGTIKRFHQGAFYIADKLNLQIQPIVVHGTMQCLAKTEFFLKSGTVTFTFYERLSVEPVNIEKGETYREQAKALTCFFRKEYDKIREQQETVSFYKRKLISQYIYKGPVLEWYMRIKIKLDGYYAFFDSVIPKSGQIVDIGCGYGFMSYMLHFLSEKRNITGVDYDAEKISVAQNCSAKHENVKFVCHDVFKFDFNDCDAFIISDVLHYFNEDKQKMLIEKCIEKLNPGGVLVIRDADKNKKKRHWGTRYTEFFSTKSGFNKMGEGKLFFTSKEQILNVASQFDVKIDIIDNTKLTSNIVFIIKKNSNERI